MDKKGKECESRSEGAPLLGKRGTFMNYGAKIWIKVRPISFFALCGRFSLSDCLRWRRVMSISQ